MGLTTVAYSMIFGWPYAVGMVGLIAIHEIGHGLVMIHQGSPFTPMVMIPFLGAVIAMKDAPKDAYREALIAFGGPFLGSVGALAVALAGDYTGSQLLLALGNFGFMINLFNLLPIGQLDGGRIGGAISPYLLLAGLACGVYGVYIGLLHSPLVYLILLLGGWTTFQRFRGQTGNDPSYYRITSNQRSMIAFLYFGLIAILALLIQWNSKKLKSPRQLKQEIPGAQDINTKYVEEWDSEFDE